MPNIQKRSEAKRLPERRPKFKARLHSADKAPAMIGVHLGLGSPWIRSQACDHNIQALQVQLEVQRATQNLHNELSVSGWCHHPANSFNKILRGAMNQIPQILLSLRYPRTKNNQHHIFWPSFGSVQSLGH